MTTTTGAPRRIVIGINATVIDLLGAAIVAVAEAILAAVAVVLTTGVVEAAVAVILAIVIDLLVATTVIRDLLGAMTVRTIPQRSPPMVRICLALP